MVQLAPQHPVHGSVAFLTFWLITRTSCSIPASGHHFCALHADNQLTELLDIPAPAPSNLRTADFRRNRIRNFGVVSSRLADFPQLHTCALDNNQVSSALGISGLTGLRHLSLSHNQLSTCEGLGEFPVWPTACSSPAADVQRCVALACCDGVTA
jgi:hypothetical protein